ncbi:MAG TPA: phage holin family protein [Candidatus Paceibacterota bacterium]|nr:phage holin family protein [Candidatus Paceibacterota bacterium]
MKIIAKFLVRLIVFAFAILLLPHAVQGIAVAGFYPALVVALMIGILNITVRPIIKLVTLPINILTLGLFGLVINGLLLWFVASFVAGFSVASFTAAFLGALILSVVNWLVHLL